MTPSATQQSVDGAVRTILVADDDEKNLYMLEILLTRHGYRVLIASTGAEALQAARQSPPDLIISDILMPVMDGFALCREWRRDERLQSVPFIFYTATYTEGRDRDFALSLGANRFLVKPVDPELLLQAIQETLARSRSLAPSNGDNAQSPPPAHAPVVLQPPEESAYLKQYNAALIRKLETKMMELERTNRELERDIAARKQAEAALRESEAMLRGFFDSAGGMRGIVEAADGDVIHVSDNEVAASHYGRTKEALRGKREAELGIHRKVTKLWLEWLTKARDTGAPVAFDYSPCDDEQGPWLSATVSYLGESAQGRPRFAYVTNDITQRKRAEKEIRQSHEQLRALLARLQTLREEERTRISREIHDELGQQLTGLKMDLRWIERHWEDVRDPRASALFDKLVTASGLVDTTIQTIQRIATELRPGVLDRLGLGPALRGEVDRFRDRTCIQCQLSVPPDEVPVPREVATAFFRIVQETLTNVARHAEASEATVRFSLENDMYLLEVCDNGRGISPSALQDARSLGLLGIQERVRLVGGEVAIVGEPGQGTTVRLKVPRRQPETK